VFAAGPAALPQWFVYDGPLNETWLMFGKFFARVLNVVFSANFWAICPQEKILPSRGRHRMRVSEPLKTAFARQHSRPIESDSHRIVPAPRTISRIAVAADATRTHRAPRFVIRQSTEKFTLRRHIVR
jgi:hypothetical protein